MGIALHKRKSSGSTLMTEGTIWKHILLFSIPLILGNMLQQLYNTVDSIVVGNSLGSEALAAVGSSSDQSADFLQYGGRSRCRCHCLTVYRSTK